jgi:hypothetical protein
MSEEPEDLLLNRLIILDKQILEYKQTIETCRTGIQFLMDMVEKMVESLPEPEVMRDAANYVDYPMYKEYLLECANLFDYYKINILLSKEINK